MKASPVEMHDADVIRALKIIEELKRIHRAESIESFEPYPKQQAFFASQDRITGFFAGNGSGKSDCAAIETACHLTGKYPSWWKGYRYTEPIRAWAVGVTNESTRENCQYKLFGINVEQPEGGWLNPDDIIDWTRRQGVSGAIDTIRVRHISGGVSYCTFKANEMGRAKLQGPRLNWIWCDEEMDKDVFDELVFRMVGVPNAHLKITFTSLQGFTDLVMFLRETEPGCGVKVIDMAWSEAMHEDGRTHLTEELKAQLRLLYKSSPHIMRSRETGLPTIASGLVYPFLWKDISIKRFPLEKFWPRLTALDVGWKHPTAAVSFAKDLDSGTIYGYNAYKQSELQVIQHCIALQKWGDMPILIDPASLQSSKDDGEKIYDMYAEFFDGPDWKQINPEDRRVQLADNSVLAGINDVSEALEGGHLFFMNDLLDIERELSMYRWDEKTGRPVKKNDDLMDTIRYGVRGISKARLLGKRGQHEALDLKQWQPAMRGY